jgi:hypothetical protein
MMNKLIFAGLAVGGIIITAIVQGEWTDRWNNEPSERILHFAESYDQIPLHIVAGDREWRGHEPKQDARRKARVEERAGAHKIREINYQDVATGEQITVLLVCGASRDVSNHTPNACYVSQGYKMTEPIKVFKIGGGEFYTSLFQKGGSTLRIFWAWNHAGTFEVPSGKPPVDPRREYGGRLPLNKLYLIHQVTADSQAADKSPCVEFGQEFIKHFNDIVFAPASESGAPQPAANSGSTP